MFAFVFVFLVFIRNYQYVTPQSLKRETEMDGDTPFDDDDDGLFDGSVHKREHVLSNSFTIDDNVDEITETI